MVRTIRKVKSRFQQGIGKVRRFTRSKISKALVKKQLKIRQGSCLRCGACCKLLFKCPLLAKNKDGLNYCRIHNKRPGNCRIFPLDEKCLRERDLLMPHTSCGYHFSGRKSEEVETLISAENRQGE